MMLSSKTKTKQNEERFIGRHNDVEGGEGRTKTKKTKNKKQNDEKQGKEKKNAFLCCAYVVKGKK